MYCIVTYGVKAQRNAKILKVLRQYLFRVQNSVFEGNYHLCNIKSFG